MSLKDIFTDLLKKNEYPKLIRDRIPEIVLEADGIEVQTRTLEHDEFIEFLKKKAVEEAVELASSDTDSNLLEEIADLRELLDALESAKGFTKEQVKSIQEDKRAKRGGFESRLLMLSNGKDSETA